MKHARQQALGYVVGGVLVLGLIPGGIYGLAALLDARLAWVLVADQAARICLGLLLALPGLAFGIWAIAAQGSEGKGGPVQIANLDISPRTSRLVTSGPYALSRNPMLFGACLLYFGFAVLLNSPAALGLAAVFMLAMLVFVKRSEEKRLSRDFGSAYAEYRSRVSFFIPWPARKPRARRPGSGSCPPAP